VAAVIIGDKRRSRAATDRRWVVMRWCSEGTPSAVGGAKGRSTPKEEEGEEEVERR
jgi:hypothetical protein